jgi:SulP family sulfate permease
VAQALEEIDKHNPKHLLIVGYAINFIDVSGAMVLVKEALRRQKLGKNLYLCRVNQDVQHFLINGEFMNKIGKSHLFKQESQAISIIYKKLDPVICQACKVRIFRECPTDPII